MNVIGFVEEAHKLEGQLTTIVNSLKSVSVDGAGGPGKTTLVKKVYNDLAIKGHFSSRVWIYVSQKYNRMEVLSSISGSLMHKPIN